MKTRVTERLKIKHPIIQGPFGGGLSSSKLAAAAANAGGLGSFGAHHLSAEAIKEIAADIRKLTTSPFALNLWIPVEGERSQRLSRAQFQVNVDRLKPYYQELGLPAPAFTEKFSPDFDEQVEALLEAKPNAFSFIYGVPAAEILKACRQRNIVTLGTATNVDEALALEEAGVDIIVASGSEAGGHRASFLRHPEESPAGSALVPQVVDRVKIPVVAAGGIADGRGVVSALAWGADGVQVGTAFLACEESNACPAHREALRNESARYTALTKVFSGRYARGVKNRFMVEMREHENELPPYPIHNWFTQPVRQAAAKAGKADLLALWSGQNAPLIRHAKAAELMRFLLEDTERVLRKLAPRP